MVGFGRNEKKENAKNDKRKDPTPNEQEFIGRALGAYQKGDMLSAKTILENAIEIFPTSSIALGYLATIEKALGAKEKALMFFEKSVSIDRSRADILHNYSGLLGEVDIEKALAMSDRAIAIAPNNSAYLERSGYLKWKSNDLHGALATSIKSINILEMG